MSYRSGKSDRVSALDRITRSMLLICSLVLSSCITAAAAETTSLSWIAWFALLPIFITIRVAAPRLALMYGALWGFCLYIFYSASNAAAVSPSLHSMGLLAAVPAIYTYFGARVTRRIGYAPLVLAVGWMIVELALQPVAFDRGLLAGSIGNGDLMHLVGGVLGYVFVAFVIAFVNAQILSLAKYIICPEGRGHHVGEKSLAIYGWLLQKTNLRCSIIKQQPCIPRAPPLQSG